MKIKKFLLILLVFLGVCFINTDNIYALKGDANKDGKIDCADYSTLKKFVNGTNIEISKTNADVNSDGIVNQKDFEDWETRMGIICRPATEQDFLGELTCGETDFKFHQSLPKFTATIYDVLKIATPIIVIVTGMIDLLKAVTSQKEDEIKKNNKNLSEDLSLVLLYS